MFFNLPAAAILAVYVAAAVLPAFFLLRYIYKMDRTEREPRGLLLKLVLLGIPAALVAGVVETVAQPLLGLVARPGTARYIFVLAFLGVAVVEEGAKLFFLRRSTWLEPNFNYRFDGVVYAVCISLGFAAFENVGYVFNYGLSVALPRALLAVPGHMGFAVFMGVFYGRAKVCESWGDMAGKGRNLWVGYLLAVLLHGFYDFCAMLGTTAATVVFLAFVGVMYVIVYRRVRREAESDERI